MSEDLILKDFLHKWLTTFKVHEVCSRTMELYYSSERLHIVPALGNAPLNSLTPMKIQTFLFQLQAEKNLSNRTISLIRGTLIQMYDYAMEMRLVESNPARNTKLPRQPRKAAEGEDKVIPIAQREALLKAAAEDPIMSPIITTLMLTGMRTYSGFRASYRHFLKRNGFEEDKLNLHRYRHTYVSMLLEQEINPKIVQKLLGHRDVSTTLGVYTHVVPEVFSGVTTAVNSATQQLLEGKYTPKMSGEQIRNQLRQIDRCFLRMWRSRSAMPKKSVQLHTAADLK